MRINGIVYYDIAEHPTLTKEISDVDCHPDYVFEDMMVRKSAMKVYPANASGRMVARQRLKVKPNRFAESSGDGNKVRREIILHSYAKP